MRKAGLKIREIRFFSEKNNQLVIVHTKEERLYAERLEKNPEVVKYETSKELEIGKLKEVPRIGIRKQFIETKWCSDFYIIFKDGTLAIREVVSHEDLTKQAEVEKLELSRRYWKQDLIHDWKVVLIGGK